MKPVSSHSLKDIYRLQTYAKLVGMYYSEQMIVHQNPRMSVCLRMIACTCTVHTFYPTATCMTTVQSH